MEKLSKVSIQVLENSSAFFGVADMEGKALFVNKSGRKIFGLDPNQEISDLSMLDFIANRSAEDFQKEVVQKSLEVEKVSKKIWARNFKNKEEFELHFDFFVDRDETTGEPIQFMAFGKDLRANSQTVSLLDSIEKALHVGGWELDVLTGQTVWTDEVYRIHKIPIGTPTDKIMGINFYAKRERERITKCLTDCIQNKSQFDEIFEFYNSDNEKLWVRSIGEAILNPQGEVIKVAGTFQEVTSLRNLEIEKQIKSEQLVSLIKNVPGMVYQFQMNEDGSMFFPFVSSKAFDIYEVKEEEFLNNAAIFLEMVHPDDASGIQEKIAESAQNLTPFKWDGRIIAKSGKVKYIMASSIPKKIDYGSILWDGLVIDISVEKELDSQLKIFKAVIENMQDFIGIANLDGVPIYVNPNGKKMVGLKESDPVEKTLIPEYYPEKERELVVPRIIKGMTEEGIWAGETYFRNFETDEKIPVFDTHFKVYDPSSKEPLCFATIVRDLTVEKNLQAQIEQEKAKLIQSSKLATLGEMAAGIAHELNNPLSILAGTLDMMGGDKINLEKLEKFRQRGIKSVERISRIVSGLKKFSRSEDEIQKKEVSVNSLINDCIELASIRLKSSSLKITNFVEEDLKISVDEIQIEQVMINLLNNSIDEHGKEENSWIEISSQKKNNYLELIFKDSGKGIPNEVIDRLFDPFYTTKEVGKGTGLGLSISRGIAQAHEGDLEYRLIDGHTAFILSLPI